jgi:ATP-dependent DNA helicase RecG
MIESEKLECKSSLGEWKEIVVTLAAFANKHGGRALVGVADDGSPLGLTIGKGALEDLANKIKNHTDPVLYPSINVRTFGPGEVIEIDVAESDNKPVFAFDHAYVRIGRTNQRLSNAAVRELIRRYTLPDFDAQCLPGRLAEYTLDSTFIRTAAKGLARRGFRSSTTEALRGMGLLQGERLTHTAYLCFTSKNTAMRNAIVKAARFKGKTMATFIDMKDFDANLPAVVDPVLAFVQRHTSMEVVISGKAKRDEAWDYPLPALREAVINALVHRDYTDPGNVQIRIFDDRLEVWSPGLLPKELDVRTIGKEHRSIPRNRNIAEVFHALGLIEGWGSGFIRMMAWARDNGNVEPLFREVAGAFVVTFPRRGGVNGGANGGVNGGVNGGANGGANGGVNGGANGTDDNVLLSYITRSPGMRTHSMAAALGRPLDTVEKQLRRLKKGGRIEFRGAPKTGGYYVRVAE